MTVTKLETGRACYVTRSSCRACGHENLEPMLSLGEQFLVDFPKDINHGLPRAPLDLVRCGGCGLLQLAHSADPELLYRDFWYRSSVNQTMRLALQDVVREVVENDHRWGTWLDIGANDGYLLSRVKGFHRIGCEPATVFEADLKAHCEEMILDFFRGQVDPQSCDVITSIAMFYDLDDPDTFLEHIARSLKRDGVWINQLNDSPTMLSQNAFDSIVHEHLCYYDVPSLQQLYRKHGLEIVRISRNDVNGGSIRVAAKKRGKPTDLSDYPAPTREQVRAFASRTRRWRALMQDYGSYWAEFNVWGYGASTKGACLLQYLGEPWVSMLKGVADRNRHKHGLRMVGSWTAIASEAEMRQSGPDLLLVMPWAFRKEFVAREAALREAGTAMLFPLPNLEVIL